MLAVPVAVFQCCPESIFFDERRIQYTGTGQVKIGRAIAQLKARPDNLIFDCKVLSRNHALVWYENGKFLLQDTRSSNGTFINNAQIPSEESSPPTQVYSRDYIQFGISVVDNDTKVTHGCIVAQAFLYHADGREALKESNGESSVPGGRQHPLAPADARLQGQLARYLKEALAREQMLDKKIRELQTLVTAAQQSSESAWQASVDEERLLTRLEMLEDQLTIFKGHFSEDEFRSELSRLKAEQMSSDLEGKDSLCHALEEKTRAVVRMAELENRLTSTEEECERLRQACQQAEDELVETIEKLNTKLDEVQELKSRIDQEETSREETVRRLEAEKSSLEQKLEEATQNETELTARLSSLLAEQQQQLTRLDSLARSVDSNASSKLNEGGETAVAAPEPESVPLQNGDSCANGQVAHDHANGGSDKPVANGLEERQHSADTINELESRLEEGHKSVVSLHAELETSQAEAAAHLARIASLEETLHSSEQGINDLVENAANSLQLQLAESEHHVSTSRQIKQQLQDRIGQLEMELSAHFSSSQVTSSVDGANGAAPLTGNPLVESSGDSDLSSDAPNTVADSLLLTTEDTFELKSENDRYRRLIDSLRDENDRLLREFEELKETFNATNVVTPNGPVPPVETAPTSRNAHNHNSSTLTAESLNSTAASFNESLIVNPLDEHYWRRLFISSAVLAVILAVVLAVWQSG